jgi:cation-transporting P-type ATPase E
LVADVVTELTAGAENPSLTGLTDAEVRQRFEAGAVNRVDTGPSRTVADIIRSNVITLFNVLLGVLLAVILFVAPPQDALFGVVLVSNALIGIIQELRAKRTLDRLALLNAPRAVVIREGNRYGVPVDEVVLDDLLTVTAGDQMVVDGVVVAGDSLEVDESLLTGEADPIHKERGDEVLSGSFVSAGSGIYKARRVGPDAYAARLAAEAKKFTLVRSELRRGIDVILAAIGWVMAPTMALLIWSQLKANDELREAIRVAVGGMVAMIPQGLVLLLSVAFAVGVVRLGRRNALVQELAAVEGLARVDVVCFDKTGTLTEGRLAVDEVVMLSDGPAHEALGALAAADTSPNATTNAIADAFPEPVGWWVATTVPFSSARKWSGADFQDQGTWIVGAPEMVLPHHAEIAREVDAAASAGKRVLLLAHSSARLAGAGLPDHLEPVALVTISDQIRPEAVDTLRFFAEQGVEVKVISGDHPETVAAIAAQVGLEGGVVDARTLPEKGPELDEAVERGTVFGRVTPHQKRAMVAALQRQGHVVAMTGDGVNDVLALKDADIGIAMGSGSSASRAVSQFVLLDGNFATLPSIVAEGRRVIANIERVANLFVTKTVYAFLLAVLVGIFAQPFPFVPRHLTLVGTLTIGAPAFFLALAPNASRARPGFVKRVLRFAFPVGFLAAVATYAAYEMAIAEDTPLLEARTLATFVLISIGLFALVINSRPLTAARRVLIGTMAGLFALILLTAGGREFFEFALPTPIVFFAGLGIVALTGSLLYGSLRAFGWLADMPDLLRREMDNGTLGKVRSRVERMRIRARRLSQPKDD